MIGGFYTLDLDKWLLATRINFLATRAWHVLRQILRRLVMMPSKKFTAPTTAYISRDDTQTANIIVASLMLLDVVVGDDI